MNLFNLKAKHSFTALLTTVTLLFNLISTGIPNAFAEAQLKITGVAGSKTPDVPLADTSMPDIVLDQSLAGDINVDVSSTDIPDGTRVKLKFKDEQNLNPPEGSIQSGMATIPVNLQAGNVKTIYLETDPYLAPIAAFSPTDITNLKLWLKADDGVRSKSLAAKFLRLNNQSLSIPSNSNICLSSNQDFTFTLWVNLDSKAGSWGQSFISKDDGTGRAEPMEYSIGYNSQFDRFRFGLGNGSQYSSVDANTLGSPNTGNWYFIVAWHDSVKDTLNIQVNNDVIDSKPWSGGTLSSSFPLLIGSGFSNIQTESQKFNLDGRMQCISFWKKVLSAEERSSLYNKGTGKLYSDLTSEQKSGLTAWWDLTELSGQRLDSHSNNHLTDNNKVLSSDGIITGKSTDGSLVNFWADKSGQENNLTQAITDNLPIFKQSVLNGKPSIKFDGINDNLAALSSITDLSQRLTTYFVVSQNILQDNTIWSTEESNGGDQSSLINNNGSAQVQWSYPVHKASTNIAIARPALYTGIIRATNYATGTVTWRVNGKDLSTSSSGKRSQLHDGNLTLGAKSNGTKPFNGDIFEVLIFEGEHTAKQISQIESYLKTKYAL